MTTRIGTELTVDLPVSQELDGEGYFFYKDGVNETKMGVEVG